MESSAAVLRPFNHSVDTQLRMRLTPVFCTAPQISAKSSIQALAVGRKVASSPITQKQTLASSVKASESAVTDNSDILLESKSQGSVEKNSAQTAGFRRFPNGFEALVTEVCDGTEIAELKLKIGDFEMLVKRNVGISNAHMPVISPTTAPPIPTEPMVESASFTSPSSPPKAKPEKTSPFTNLSPGNSLKLAALEASGTNTYVLVSSPTVGSFRRGRTLKGKKQPPICKEGDVIKEGQIIGYLEQFGTELPVRSDVSGEIVKLVYADGEAVGYGDPLIAVLPSFHDIK